MKILLACLMCLVLTASECFALAGGPVFTTLDPAGTYAGSMRARKRHLTDFPRGCSLNSLGVFALSIDASGAGTGDFVLFSQGRVFTGTISGNANVVSGRLSGVLNATVNFTVTIPINPPTTFDVTAQALGHLQAKITDVQLKGGTIMATRLLGSASLAVDQGEVDLATLRPITTCQMALRVNGFKQSNSTTTPAMALRVNGFKQSNPTTSLATPTPTP
jgi:hypothetical protein